MTRSFWMHFYSCLLPLLAFGSAPHGLELDLLQSECLPGDMIEIQAEMYRSDFAEFELHVPAHPQLHFVARTVEPVQYVEGAYVQRSSLLLQAISAGQIELPSIKATIKRGETLTEVSFPTLKLLVNSYGELDASNELAPLELSSTVAPKRSSYIVFFLVLISLAFLALILVVLCFKLRPGSDPNVSVVSFESLDDLSASLERGDCPVALIERLIGRSDLSLSVALREALELAVYANRFDRERLLRLIREEAAG